MNKFHSISSRARALAPVSAALLMAGFFHATAVQAASTTANASATVITPIAIAKTADLAFGSFSAATAGTVAIATDGTRTATGGVLLSSQTAGGAAAFNVTGQDTATYAITLPTDSTVTLSGPGTAMAVDSFVSNPSGTGTLGATGQAVNVGATLTVGPAQAEGAYTGTFNVAVEYN